VVSLRVRASGAGASPRALWALSRPVEYSPRV
jgi:hypothetical protein